MSTKTNIKITTSLIYFSNLIIIIKIFCSIDNEKYKYIYLFLSFIGSRQNTVKNQRSNG